MKAFVARLIEWGPWGLFILAFLDGIGVPLPGGVDALLVYLCVKNPAQAYLYAAITTVASVVGGVLLFVLARNGGEAFLAKHTADGRGEAFKKWFLRYGLITVFVPAFVFVPLPLKVFVICAGAMGVPFRRYLGTLLLARIPRFFGMAWLGATYGDQAWPWLKSHGWHMAGIAVALSAAIYLGVKLASEREFEASNASS